MDRFEKKVPLLSTPLEATWLYHEMGRCYLEMNRFNKAKDCGDKSLKSARETDDKPWQLNANVLLAQTEGMSIIDIDNKLGIKNNNFITARSSKCTALVALKSIVHANVNMPCQFYFEHYCFS